MDGVETRMVDMEKKLATYNRNMVSYNNRLGTIERFLNGNLKEFTAQEKEAKRAKRPEPKTSTGMKTIRTEHFSLAELVYSNKATELHIDNTPTPDAVANLCTLMTEVLEPARCKLGAPIIITSGYRCPALNKSLAG